MTPRYRQADYPFCRPSVPCDQEVTFDDQVYQIGSQETSQAVLARIGGRNPPYISLNHETLFSSADADLAEEELSSAGDLGLDADEARRRLDAVGFPGRLAVDRQRGLAALKG